VNVVFRVDASNEIGSGHVVRCKALARILLERGHKCSFVSADLVGNHISLLKEDGINVDLIFPKLNIIKYHNENDDIQFCKKLEVFKQADWVVVDHYHLGCKWQKNIKTLKAKLLVIDDRVFTSKIADIFLNQNFQEKKNVDISNKICKHFIGPKYALVAREFKDYVQKSIIRKKQNKLDNLIICMGGGDTFTETIEVIDGVVNADHKWKSVNIVVGKSSSNISTIKSIVNKNVGWYLHIQTKKMANLLADADLAITGGGSISWEKCVLGVPSIVKILEENQEANSKILEEMGCHILVERNGIKSSIQYTKLINKLDQKKISEMSFKSSLICDSFGALRIGEEMENISS
jgi:UDP-2,4-diacetamido-2,4,6-trideoxy-beta-L-altropyranose hydrolase